MTSERNKRVEEEESTNRRAERWQDRPSEQVRGRDRCPCKVRREVEKMAACGRAAEGNRGEISTVSSWESK